MELPLFKGIGEEQLSLLLEKTSVEFLKFEDGDTIAEANEKVSSVSFILNGRVKKSYALENLNLGIDEILGKGSVLGAINLYGLNTTYTAKSIALGRVSLMRISKADYMNILLSDKIYVLNFVNYLSAAAQKTPLMLEHIQSFSIETALHILAFSLASRLAETVMVSGDDIDIAQYCGVSIEDFKDWKSTALAHKKILVNQKGIFLKSPHLQR